MSERGSFVTEYINCKQCCTAAKEVLLQNNKYLHGIVIPGYTDGPVELPIIAGKIGGLYAGEELVVMETEIVPKLSKVICHPMRIAVLANNGQSIFNVKPERG